MLKPIRFPGKLIVALPLVAALAACATHPAATEPHQTQVTVTAIAPTGQAPAPAAAGTAGSTHAEGSAAGTPPAGDAAAPEVAAEPSLVAVPPPDLFVRLRGGFKLEDLDQPAIDRELNWFANHPDYLERVWGRAELYLHYIVGQLNARGMPLELALLPVVESAFEPYAYSRARASGLWQFIPGTGSRYGLKQDWWYDGRRDVVASTRGALDYLQALHDEFDGDWLLAIAAYNCGELNVERAVKRNQRAGKPTDFWHLKLPTETRAYVPKLLAMRRIVANPAVYGLEFSQIPDVAYFTEVKTGGQIDMAVVAEIAQISKDELYELNPAFHRFATDPTGPYTLLVPTESAEGLEATLMSLTPEQRMRVEHYEVAHGDTLASIATHYSTTPEMLRELNGMGANETPAIGNTLSVPAAGIVLPDKALRAAMLFDHPKVRGRRGGRPVVHVVRRGDTLYGIAQRLGTDVSTLARLNNMQAGDPIHAGQRLVVSSKVAHGRSAKGNIETLPGGGGRQVTYTVRNGDTLWSISQLLQVTVRQLLGWNDLASPHALRPGQKLVAFVSHGG